MPFSERSSPSKLIRLVMSRKSTFCGVTAVMSGISQTRPAPSITKSLLGSPGTEQNPLGRLKARLGNRSCSDHVVGGGLAGSRAKAEAKRGADVKLIVTVAGAEAGLPLKPVSRYVNESLGGVPLVCV